MMTQDEIEAWIDQIAEQIEGDALAFANTPEQVAGSMTPDGWCCLGWIDIRRREVVFDAWWNVLTERHRLVRWVKGPNGLRPKRV